MLKVEELYNLNPTAGDIGIEIEVEGNNLPVLNSYWKWVGDDSLRGESAEYVLKKPLSLKDSRKALKYLHKAYIESETVVHDSVRAGVHVHINVQKLTTVQLYNFITTYIILEDLLIKYCGEYREGNLFCLRTRDAELLLHTLENVAKDKNFGAFEDDLLRYASMNVCSLPKFGSLEFRAMRGTRDLDLIGDWAELLLNLKEESLKFDNPLEIMELLGEIGAESFCKRFLGTFSDKVCNDLPVGDMLLEGLTRVHPLVVFTEWSSFETRDIGGIQFPTDVEFPDEPMEDF